MPTPHNSSVDASPIPPSSQARSLWRNPDYLFLWSGQALSDIGGAISELAFPLLVLAITHSPEQAGFGSALRSLPALFFPLFAGVIVDRWDRKKVMLVCEVGRALSLASIPLAFAFGHLTIWQLYINAFLEGSLLIVFDLAKTTAIMQVIRPEHISTAVAQDELVEGTTSLFGPFLSGVLYALGMMIPFLADAFSYLISIVTLLLIRTPFQQQREVVRRDISGEIIEGIRWILQQPFILAMTLLMGAGAFVFSSWTLLIIVLMQQQHISAAFIGLVFACGGIGSILGSVLAPRLMQRLTVGQSVMLVRWYLALSWPLLALAPFPFVFAALEFGAGFMDPLEDVPYFSYRQRLIPDELKGRVISVCRMLPGIMRPLGLALAGILIQRAGALPTIWLAWIWLLVTTGIVTVIPHIRRVRAS